MSDEKDIDYGADILTLVDEEGAEHEFEVVGSDELDGQRYMALVPVFEDGADLIDDSGELIILRVVEEDGEEILEAIEDEEEFDRIADFFMNQLADEFDFEE